MSSNPEKLRDEEAGTMKPDKPEEGASTFNMKSILYASAVLIAFFALITILTRTLADDDEDSSSNLSSAPPDISNQFNFNRIANFPVCLQIDNNCNDDTETVSEIIYASKDGNTLVYTDASREAIGFIDITNPTAPQPDGIVAVGGEPTSVAVIGEYAIVCVSTSPSFTAPSGIFHIIDMATKEVLRTGDLGGQPDATAISPDENFIAIAIENERDEDLNGGMLPQLPAGFLVVMDTSSDDIQEWSLSTIDLTGLDGVLYPSDPEPEYVEINDNNEAVVTLQENNALVIVDLESGLIIKSFSAGSVDLSDIDVIEDGRIEQTGSQFARLREPDAVTWIGTDYFATADEGDLDGGSRTFTIFDKEGNVVYDSGSDLEDWVTRIGHYPDERSENKGNEPETVRYYEFADAGKLLFVNSERSSVIFVYEVSDVRNPVLRQILPSGGVGPEGIFAIPERNLLVVANEDDVREDKIRAAVSIFELQNAPPVYPTIESTVDEATNKYIPFSALSGLAANGATLFSIEDSFYKSNRMFVIDSETSPAKITQGIPIVDTSDILANALSPTEASILLNTDKTVNLDLEGIDLVSDDLNDGFWLVSEGVGSVDDIENPVETPNLLLRVSSTGEIDSVVTLPDEVNNIQTRFGFEGVASEGDNVVVAFQRAWTNETDVRLGIYDTVQNSWNFVFYPLDAPESQYGGWVGLSDMESLGDGIFLVLERDNQAGLDAAIKRVYTIDLGDFSLEEGTMLEKALLRDLMPDLQAFNGPVIEKVEGMTVDGAGNLWINTDNDGVDDSSGEQLLLNLGPIG